MNEEFYFEVEPFEFQSELAQQEWEAEFGRRQQIPGRFARYRQALSRSRRRPVRPSRPPIRPRWPPRRPGWPSVAIYEPPGAEPVPEPEGSEYVRWVQNTLNQVMSLRLPVDGIMGPETRSAIRSFQQRQGLPVDGIVGPETERALGAAIDGQSPDAQTEFEAFDTELADQEWQSEVNRSSSDYIQWVQRSLNQIMGLQLAVDGISGTQTRSAIRSFQQQRGLAVDGIVGPQTEQALIAAGAGNPPGAGAPSYTPPSTQPSTSSRAQLAQQVLNHNNISLWPHSPTGSNSSDGADAHSNVSDTASGRAATRSNYENAPGGSVNLDTRMLDGMLKLANTYDIEVTSIAGGSHSSTSRHYAGVALDVNEINGVHVTASNPYYRALMQKCRDLGATEVLGPGDSGHDTHVHCAWPRP